MPGNEFMEGAGQALSIFQATATMSNYQALQEDRAERRDLQRSEHLRKSEEDKQKKMQQDYNLSAMAMDPHKVPIDTALNHFNTMAVEYGNGTRVTKEDYTKFTGEVEALFSRADLPNSESRRQAAEALADKATEHPAYLRGLQEKKAKLENWIERPAASALFAASGFAPERTEHLLQNVRPGEAIGMLKDGDWRKAALLNQASDVMGKVAKGEDVAEGELAQALTAAHGAGFKLGESGAEIVKGTTGEAQYNLAQKDVDSLNKTVASPFAKLFEMIPQDKAIKSMVFTSAIEDPTTALAKHLKPEQNKQFQEVVGKMELVSEQAQKKFQDLQARFKIAKANPVTTPADLILLEQQMGVEREKTNALMEPFKRFNTFKEEPTEANYKAVTMAGKHLDETLRRFEGSKAKLLTLSQQKEQQEMQQGKVTFATKQATNDFAERFMAEVGNHPEWYDEDGTLNVSKASKVMTPIAKELTKGHGAHMDVDEVLGKFATAGKRSVPRTDTLEKLSPEQAAKFETFVSGVRNTHAIQDALIQGGKVDRKLLAQSIGGGVPFTNGRTLQAYVKDALDAEYRARTGAAMPESEWTRAWDTFGPKQVDSDKTIISKLDNLEQHFQSKVDLTDPRGTLSARVGATKRRGGEQKDAPAKKPTLSAGDIYDKIRKENPKLSPAEVRAKAAAALRGDGE